MVHDLHVLLDLYTLELVDGKLALVNSDKVDKLTILIDVKVELLDVCLVVEDILLNLALGLEETLKCRLSHGHLV